MKYKVTTTATWVDGVKYRRGDIVELPADRKTSTDLELVVEVEKPKPVRKTRAKKVVVDESR